MRPRLIGDVLLTTPVIRAMRRRYPDAELVYLVEAHAAPVVTANPHLSETIVIRHRRGLRRLLEDLRLAIRLRARRFDVAVDMHGGSRSGWLTFATGARMRVGYDVSGRSWMYTHRVARPVGYVPRHSVFSMWDLAAVVDRSFADPPTPSRDRLEMPVTPAAAAAVARRLEQLGVTTGDEVVVMHAAAGNEFRRWPEAAFGAVARALAAAHRRVVLVVGSHQDAATIDRIVSLAQAGDAPLAGRVHAAPGWPLEELRALMDRAALFVGGDSGPMHIAAASDVPIVAIFGPTLPAHWAPWRPAEAPVAIVEPGPLECRPCDQRVCAPGDFRCLRALTPDQVIAAANGLLETQ
ncbi:MAG TPA: glycosyltransferase family 9 protein [Vicinamibacterales bacterium]|nr:glycosyltransferase family 9 protein [Vicinamibacterales bacterium]